MFFIKRIIRPEWMLRLGLGAMFLYSGLSLLRTPEKWTWAVRGLPETMLGVIQNIGIERFLMGQGIVEIVFAVSFLIWLVPRKISTLCAFLASLEMIFILMFIGIEGGTFRDIGLLGATLALYISLKQD